MRTIDLFSLSYRALTINKNDEGILLGLVFWILIGLLGGLRIERLNGYGVLTFHFPFIIAAMACPRLPRSTGTHPMRSADQPRMGAHFSSFFMMNFARGMEPNRMMMSKKE